MKTAHRTAARAKRRRWLPDPTLLGRLTDTTPLREPEQTGLALPARLAYDAIANGSGGDDESIQQAEIDLHRLQHIESAALLALGMLWISGRVD